MENNSRLGQLFQRVSDKIQDQPSYQQLKAKWDELDPKSRTVLKVLVLGGGSLALVLFLGNSIMAVQDQKQEIEDRLALIQKIQSSQEELRKLREMTAGISGGDGSPWSGYLESLAVSAGIAGGTLAVGPEQVATPPKEAKKPAAGAKDKDAAPVADTAPVETLVEVVAKKINVRQLVKFVYAVENGNRTAKVRQMRVNTDPEENGYMDVTLEVSGFTIGAR